LKIHSEYFTENPIHINRGDYGYQNKEAELPVTGLYPFNFEPGFGKDGACSRFKELFFPRMR
jgi:hypothetical protein